MTLLERLDAETPPFMVYALCRAGRYLKWRGPQWISTESGIPERTVHRIGGSITWRGNAIETVSTFLHTCGFEINEVGIIKMKKTRNYLKWIRGRVLHGKVNGANIQFRHLNDRQWKKFNERCRRWNEAQAAPTVKQDGQN